MKLVQLNIWQGRLLREVISFLEAEDADIVCLQEVFSSGTHVSSLEILSSLEQIQAAVSYPHVFYAPTFSFDVSGVKAFMGNAILSKLPLENQRTIFANNDFHEVYDWAEHHPANTRNAPVAEVSINGKTATIVCHHGYWHIDPMGDDMSVAAMQKVVESIRSVPSPIILAGDLNITAESPAMRLFDGWLEDLTATHEVKDSLSRFGKVSGVPCDHILVSPDVQVQKFEVSEALVSDHKALILEFDI